MDSTEPGTSSAPMEPGACRESSLITTDTFEELSQEMNANLTVTGKILEKDNDIGKSTDNLDDLDIDETVKAKLITSDSRKDVKVKDADSNSVCSVKEPEDLLQDPAWLTQKLHVFILSAAGKPIYALYGNEDKLASVFAVMQALVSVVQANQDSIKSIHAKGLTFVFLVKGHLILVAVSRLSLSVPQIQMQLTDVYNLIISTLTLDYMNKIFEKRKNFDLRRLLGGSERLIEHLLLNNGNPKSQIISNNPFVFLTHSVRILPMSSSVREQITSTITANCSKVNNLVFAVLIAKNKLITMVRNKKCYIHPADLRLIFNLVECSESFKSAESWTPMCLPKFNPNGYLHAYVSYLSDECEACLLFFTVEREIFFTLSEIKEKIVEKLRKSNCLDAINEAIHAKGVNLRSIGVPEIRHFLYKCKYNAQLLCSEITVPYNSAENFERLETMYYHIHHRIHSLSRPCKLIYEMREKETLLAWITTGYELYATFEPFIDKLTVIALVNKLMRWIKKEENYLFMMNSPTF